jgi:hypothetical protein
LAGQSQSLLKDEAAPKFESRKTENGDWCVFSIDPSGREAQVGNFLTEDEAVTWIASDSPVWLQRHQAGEKT